MANKRLIEKHVKSFSERAILSGPVKIPLVFHILQNEKSNNTTISQVRAQVEVLNRCFAGQANSGISFELAGTGKGQDRKDAVFHYPAGRNKWSTDDAVKHAVHGGADALFPTKCLNIWVCDLEGQASGYAQMPGGPTSTDGIVVDHDFFGLDNFNNPYYNGGKTLVHLVGNYLNLHDLWGLKTCSDDGVTDTPIHNTPTRGCPACLMYSGCNGKEKMMTGNYMDNTDDACLDSFTRGQIERMRSTLSEGGPREKLGRGPLPERLQEQINNTASIKLEEEPVFSLHVFPNPASQEANLVVTSNDGKEVFIAVYNTLGSTIHFEKGLLTKGENRFAVECKGWAEGPYYITVNSQGGSCSQLLVVTHQ